MSTPIGWVLWTPWSMLLSFFSSIKHILLVLTISKTHSSSLPFVKNRVLFFLSSFLPLLTHSDMDYNPYNPTSNFVDLLQSQQHTVFGYVQDIISSQVPMFFTQPTGSHCLSIKVCGTLRCMIWIWRRSYQRWSYLTHYLQRQNRFLTMKRLWRRSWLLSCSQISSRLRRKFDVLSSCSNF